MIAATLVVAELQGSRSFDPLFAEVFFLNFLTAANFQVTSWWRGRQLGLMSFLAAAAG